MEEQDKMSKFERFTANVVCLLEYGTELLVGYYVYKVLGNATLGVLSLVVLSVFYSYTAVLKSGIKNFDIEKAKAEVTKLQPYWLLFNTFLCVVLSRLY